jgi:GT2 family glycosyltransferase/glycosyltransferase involved in cell wall biosynthesis
MTQRHALIASYYVPQAALDSSSRRLLHFIDFLLADRWHVTVVAKNPSSSEHSASLLRQRGIAIYPLRKQTIEELVSEQRFDVALLAFWHIAEPLINTIRRLSPQTRIVVDSMDLHFVRHARRAFKASPTENGVAGVDASYGDEMMREVNVYAAADAVLAVSAKEADLVNDLIGDDALARVVPDCEEVDQSEVPFQDRRGMIFVGNFEHPPNADAIRFLCKSVIPEIDPQILSEHPLYIVGRHLGAPVRRYADGISGIRLVGWVPTLIPYLERARISVVPLLYGAGTKRKVIQTLMAGTPVVSTRIGLEGLGLVDGKDALVADEPAAFAAAVERLLTDGALWADLARRGRENVVALHNAERAHARLQEALTWALGHEPKARLLKGAGAELPENSRRNIDKDAYEGLVRRIRRTVRQRIPSEGIVIVVSRGDPALVNLGGRLAWHFPRGQDGAYAGFHPADSAAAIAHVEQLRQEGADFILFPSTSLWWLGHYREFSEYLFSRFGVIYRDEDTCVIFDLRSGRGERPRNGADPDTHAPATIRVSTPDKSGGEPRISVVVPTHNRATLLNASLESLAGQTLGASDFEVVVVDDGSTDATAEVCRSYSSRLNLRYIPVEHRGIAAAKNAGTFAARGALVFFFDDDDLADPNLLSEHVQAHEQHPDESAAVLGYTDWASSVEINDVMDFVTNVGQYLFAYGRIRDGQRLDFTHFWGGRASCKRSLLAKYGLYRPEFEFGSEDIELAYRLSRYGFFVNYRRGAVQHMNRGLTYEDFCLRCERQGRSLALFSRMHRDPTVQRYCLVAEAAERWPTLRPQLSDNMHRVDELQKALTETVHEHESLRAELHRLYWWSFDTWKLKGVAEGLQSLDETSDGLSREALHG